MEFLFLHFSLFIYFVFINTLNVVASENPNAYHKYAYATIHYEGTAHDAEYVLGIEVMVRSLVLSNTSIIYF